MTAWAYYNEWDEPTAAWLRELIVRGLVAPGEVDTRSITEVSPDDLRGFTQAHFFAGIGGWSYALRLAGWPDDRPVWTGSCPCQPFSVGGARKGERDHRHLWPDFFALIAECGPPTIFGEQVASPDGRAWLARVFDDLEGASYAVAGADLCAAGAGAPHNRPRLYFLGLADSAGGIAADGDLQHGREHRQRPANDGAGGGHVRALGARALPSPAQWAGVQLLHCWDGRARPVEPGAPPVADGLSNRMGRIRGYGNAIVPQLAARFIEASTRL